MKFIGLSLSNCVRDILVGHIDIKNVAFIIAGTFIKDRKSLNHVIDSYRMSYWQNFSTNDVLEVLETLFFSGRIIQPRAIDLNSANIAEGHWTKYNVYLTEQFFDSIMEKDRVNP